MTQGILRQHQHEGVGLEAADPGAHHKIRNAQLRRALLLQDELDERFELRLIQEAVPERPAIAVLLEYRLGRPRAHEAWEATASPRDKAQERSVFLLESDGEPGAGGWVLLRWLKTRQLVEAVPPGVARMSRCGGGSTVHVRSGTRRETPPPTSIGYSVRQRS